MNIRSLRSGLLALFWSAIFLCNSADAQTIGTVEQEDSLLSAASSADARDDFGALESLESKALAQAGEAVSRTGRRLSLRLKSGGVKSYVDAPECGIPDQIARCKVYRLVAHARSRKVFILSIIFYESVAYLVVDEVSGIETTLRRFPIFSPSGEYLLVRLMNDDRFGDVVQVWRRAERSFVLDWSGSPHADGLETKYELVLWKREDLIELRAETRVPPWIPVVERRSRFNLRRTATGWEVVTVTGDGDGVR